MAPGSRKGTRHPVRTRAGDIPLAVDPVQAHRIQAHELDACRRCGLWANATHGVPGEGPQDASIMIVGEQPGDAEDLAGRPFVGPAGRLLDRVLEQAALERREIYVTNAVKHFKWEPRGKRRMHKTPAQREIAACRHWLAEEMEDLHPKVIVVMGSTALKGVTDDGKAKLTDRLGKPFKLDDAWVVAIYHPAYVLRVPDEEARQRAFGVMVDGLRDARRLAEEDESKAH